MPPKTPNDLRTAWRDFFVGKGHAARPGASLVPANDPTLLFTGAGMNQFKDLFLGKGTASFRRAVTVQKCLRAGDIENVGKTLRHMTFFEMLGNFSFDDYFKEEAIAWAWEFSTKVLSLPPARIAVTVFRDDEESFALWRKTGVPADRIRRFSAKANYWPQNAPDDGPDGPCGPCTEMYFDFGPRMEAGDAGPDDLDSGRYLEFWNLVFPQFDRRGKGNLEPLGRRNVDTGAGFERMLAVAEGKNAPFHTSVMMPVLSKAADLVGTKYEPASPAAPRLRRIADHARAASFLVGDGVKPSNEGRGYVLRRIIRRAIRDGILLRVEEPFLHEVVPAVVAAMKDGYPDLASGATAIQAVLRGEEEQFRATYAKGLRWFEEEVPRFAGSKRVPGAVAFRLHDTYGFPIDLLEQIASEERGFTVDREGFEKELSAQRERARAASKMAGDVFATGPLGDVKAKGGRPTEFAGYEGDGCTAEGTVVGLFRGTASVAEASAGDHVAVVLDRTPFYAEGGGQVGDVGILQAMGGRVEVRDTKAQEGFHLHVGRVAAGTVRVGDRVKAAVDRPCRDATRRNHTATHLLHEALKRVLGPHVRQQGSLVAPDRLRFDFGHGKALTAEEIRLVEDLVNEWVLANADVETQEMGTDAAKASGAVALFGENYGDRVRVVAVPEVSRELCGGTHVRRAGDIGSFRVTMEGSVAAGVRRIEAVTGLGAVAAASADRDRLREAAALLKAPPEQLAERIAALQEELRAHRRAAEKSAEAAGAQQADRLRAEAEDVGGLRVVVAEAPRVDAKGLRGLWDALRGGGVHVAFLVGEAGDKAPMLSGAAPEAVARRVDAKNLLETGSRVLGGGGGGRPDLAQGQGLDRSKREEALAAVRDRLHEVLSTR